MGEYKQTTLVFLSTLALSALGLTWVAQAQTQGQTQGQTTQTSPFARKTQTSGTTNYQYPYGGNTGTTTPSITYPSGATGTASSYGTSGSSTSTGSSSSGSAYPSSYNYSLSGSQSGSGGTAASSGTYTPPSTSSMTYGGSSTPQIYSGGSTPTFSAGTATSRPSSTSTQYNQAGTNSPYAGTSGSSSSGSGGQASGTYTPGASYDYPSYNRTGSASTQTSSQASGAYYPGRRNPYGGQNQASGNYYPQQAQNNSNGQPGPYGTPGQQPQRGWTEKLGLNNIEFYYEGEVAAGAAGTHIGSTDSWREDFIGDGYILGEVSAITQGGLEYGVTAELRGQYDQYRRGFGGRVGDCPPNIAECSSVNVNGTDVSLRGHTSRFYASGASDAKDFEVQLEGAHLFLRSAYGDVTVGRDDGAAYLFSLGAPTLLPVGASNSPVDFTGLDAVKTVNDASGFSEKITYTSPRLLGDTIGLGVQVGASYALDAEACGVDYCVRDADDEPAGVLASDIDDVVEFGLALDRKFDNGLSVEATATYSMGSQQNTQAVFDDLSALGLGLELGYGDFVLGGSYLHSNNGLSNGDYEAMDIGLTWQPSQWGLTLGYGHATDDNVGLTSDQATAGISYDMNDMFRLSTGVQYVNRDVYVYDPLSGLVNGQNENATSVFVAGRVKF